MKHTLIVAFLLLVVTLVAAAQSLPPADKPLKVGGGVSAPKVIYRQEPQYTEGARKAHVQGTVLLWLIVRADGTVGDIKVEKSLDKELDENAIASVKRWRFIPAEKNGESVAVEAHIEVTFHLDGKGDSATSRPAFPDSKIETLSDGRHVLTNAPIGVRIALPTGWAQVNYHEGTYSVPATIVLNRLQTLASVELLRQTLESSPSLYQKVFKAAMERDFQDVDTIGEEVINKPGRSGKRLLILGTRKEIKVRCTIDIYTHENQHYIVKACAPDEVFDKYWPDFNAMLKSVEFVEFAVSTVDQNK